MKKNLVILFISIFVSFTFLSCSFFSQSEDNFSEMYQNYKLADEILENASIPVVEIQTENNAKILNKEDWVIATIKISNTNSELDLDFTEVSIRGRGNTTWKNPKRPYALKFSKKQSVLGMPKHKRWVLIANYTDNSFMKNVVAFHLSEKLGLDYTVRGKYVNFILNGNYVGLYWLGEAIKVDDSRVSIDEDNDFLIEMDVYYDEIWKFKSGTKNLPYMVSNDDNMNQEKLENLNDHINFMETVLYKKDFPYSDSLQNIDETYKDYIDIDSFAKFYLVNEIMYNTELKHPKSCYFTLNSQSGILKAGPVWDFDWGGINPSNNIILTNTIYYDALFKIPEFRQKLNTLIVQLDNQEISGFIDNTYKEIAKSAVLDGQRWGTQFRNPVGEPRSSFKGYVEYLENCVTGRVGLLQANSF